MNQETIESTLSQALNSYQHPNVHATTTSNQPRGVPSSSSLPTTAQIISASSSNHHHQQQQQQQQRQQQRATARNSPSGAPNTDIIVSTNNTNNNNANNNTSTPSSTASTTSSRLNRPGQRFGAKKRSWVWNWFVQDLDDSNVAVCDQCGKIIRRLPSDKGSPKKLSEHLRTHKIDKATGNPGREHMIGIQQAQGGGPGGMAGQHNNNNQHNNVTGSSSSTTLKSVNPGGLGHIPQHLLAEFDISQYSQIKFHKDIMKFLTDNKLPISVVKSPSFRQMVFTLRPESIEDLNELNNIYASLMEVLKNNDNPTSSSPQTNTPTSIVGGATTDTKTDWI